MPDKIRWLHVDNTITFWGPGSRVKYIHLTETNSTTAELYKILQKYYKFLQFLCFFLSVSKQNHVERPLNFQQCLMDADTKQN